MIKTIRSGLWTCSRYLRQVSRISRISQVRDQRRWLSSAPGVAQIDASQIPVDHSPPDLKHDDALLRQIFDSPPLIKDLAEAFSKLTSGENVGLFRNKYLTSPQGFFEYANVTIERAQKLVHRVLNASTLEEYKAVVRDLDRLSDLLCRVLDVSDFVRVTHPDMMIQAAASKAWSLVYQYMNQLNTATGLSDQLEKALANPEVMASWNEEEQTVAKLLQQDFKKSAIHLPKGSRDQFVSLSQRISELGSNFVQDMGPEQRFLAFPSSKAYGMNPQMARRLTHGGVVSFETLSPEATVALRSVHDEDTRKAIYYATRTASGWSIRILESLLRSRAELAKLSGFESYSQMALHDKMMAKTPESVHQFLVALSNRNAPLVEDEIAALLREKSKTQNSTATDLQPWDREYYMEKIRSSMRSRRRSDSLSSYFSLGTVMQGLSRLFTRLYGIRLIPRDTLRGETWHSDVRRLDVVSDTDGHVAVLYCDLFFRDDKSPNPAHFTVRCSREISEAEIQEVAAERNASGLQFPKFESPIDAANDGMHVSLQSGSIKQLPTIALVCDFEKSKGRGPALLDYYQMETLFHEMGHAIHSILARTSLQNVAGTRCATDLAELPSTLMEHFCADPSVLGLFARHHVTDEPLPFDMVVDKLNISRRFEASDRENQIILAMLDQQYHSSLPNDNTFDSTEIYLGLQKKFGKLPSDPPGTRWQGFFGHLFGYGSTYYSYLFDQVLSKRAWQVVFSAGHNGAALDRANGERLKENLLKWGGSRDPWRCLSDTLQDERLVDGDEKAMRLVGTWVNKDDVHS
ncbi:mitochondrial intermediate peptidase-like protein [Daldinia decipiens]|uniref:mitochondrial intermediate peptidase-like protein n=1 Tax=Daldinia decipiens TaxID=326647 RepID=UPI0020C25CF1|nr:mitochondrial intermediate peptidase-like protein [Daldinia decipiens]KAI1660222.1 mitochondrial intermediate peptidase-like protein [Daldinia decipiens]